jgi:hypothetical protein
MQRREDLLHAMRLDKGVLFQIAARRLALTRPMTTSTCLSWSSPIRSRKVRAAENFDRTFMRALYAFGYDKAPAWLWLAPCAARNRRWRQIGRNQRGPHAGQR